jgi:hypothetical protein
MAFGNKVINSSDIRNGIWKTFERLHGGSQKGTVAGTGVTVTEGAGKTVFTFTNVAVATVDATTNGAQGSLKIYDFPEGLLDFRGGVSDLTISCAAGIAATSTVIASVGTAVAGVDLTLTSTEADLVPSGSVTLVASAGAIKQVSATANAALFDGTGTAKDAYLNFVVDATGSTANSTITVNGTITLAWNLIADK